jgi:hypothetical protein
VIQLAPLLPPPLLGAPPAATAGLTASIEVRTRFEEVSAVATYADLQEQRLFLPEQLPANFSVNPFRAVHAGLHSTLLLPRRLIEWQFHRLKRS